MNQTPFVRLDVLDHANLLARASNAASVMTRSLRGAAPTPEELKAACGAANGAARALNQLCDALPRDDVNRKAVRRGGKSNSARRAADFERMAALGAEKSELLALVEKMAGLVEGLERGDVVAGCAALAVASSARAALAAKGGAV